MLYTLDNLLRNLYLLAEEPYNLAEDEVPVDCYTGPMMLDMHTEHLLGGASGKRKVRIMVTMPSEAAQDKKLIHDLLQAGMDIMRINCAHDDQDAWLGMINNLRQAERQLGRPCKIYADLAGPKLRTGPIKPAGQIVKYRPSRNYRGEVDEMCHVWFTPAGDPQPAPQESDVTIPLEGDFLQIAEVGDEIHLVEAICCSRPTFRVRSRKHLMRSNQGTAFSLTTAKSTAKL